MRGRQPQAGAANTIFITFSEKPYEIKENFSSRRRAQQEAPSLDPPLNNCSSTGDITFSKNSARKQSNPHCLKQKSYNIDMIFNTKASPAI